MTGRSAWRAAIAVGVAAVLALAACGGGSSGTTSSSSGPTRAQYVARANAICAGVRGEAAPLIARVKAALSNPGAVLAGGASALHTLAGDVGRLHGDAAAGLAKLRALPQPAGERATIAGFLTPLDKLIGYIGQASTLLSKGEALNAYSVLLQATPASNQLKRAARSFGATQCGAVLAAL